MPYVGGKLLTLREAAEYLNMPDRRLRDYWKSWGLSAYKLGRELRFRERELMEWLETRKAA